MNCPPIPLVFEPLFKPKPWGGRTLATLFDKSLPAGRPIGESWELVSLPGNESRVKDGPLASRSLSELVDAWGADLYGAAELADGRFPLLIKFLDARENLSVQVHPKPPEEGQTRCQPGIKHEAWYVLHADAGAEMFIGLRPGVAHEELARSANTPRTAELLRRWPVTAGDCFYLPSGIVHALGGGLVVAEIQTPSDVTYRLYDWDRVGSDGRPRELHIEQALRNVRWDIPSEQVVQPRRQICGGEFAGATRAMSCDRFLIDVVRLAPGLHHEITHREMAIWIVLGGHGRLVRERFQVRFGRGDVVLVPAENAGTRLETLETCELLAVKIPPSG